MAAKGCRSLWPPPHRLIHWLRRTSTTPPSLLSSITPTANTDKQAPPSDKRHCLDRLLPHSLHPTLFSHPRHCHPTRIGPPLSRSAHGFSAIDALSVGTAPLEGYEQLVREGSIRRDDGQVAALRVLERVFAETKDYNPEPPDDEEESPWLRLFRFAGGRKKEDPPLGAYLYGGVGTGKSLVQDIFYHCHPTRRKRRVHFHSFMLDVHRRMHQLRNEKGQDALVTVANELLREAWLICFDEFQVTDIADAMILKRLLETLFNGGAVIVATSNRAPDELYKGGLQRDLFLPCIALLKKRCQVLAFDPNSPDYRLSGAQSQETVWHMPLGQKAEAALEQAFRQLAKGRTGAPTKIKSGTRTINVPLAAGGVARFDFLDLCGTPKGAADYLAIASSFHTAVIANIPAMTRQHAELVRRFITLIDVLYEQNVKLLCSADAPPEKLYQPRSSDSEHKAGGGRKAAYFEKDEEFAFARTVSRLNHMQSVVYLSRQWNPPGAAFLSHLGAKHLTEGDIARVWDRYNLDDDAQLSKEELKLMVEDLSEISTGNRNVPQEFLERTWSRLDANKDGVLKWTDFLEYFTAHDFELDMQEGGALQEEQTGMRSLLA